MDPSVDTRWLVTPGDSLSRLGSFHGRGKFSGKPTSDLKSISTYTVELVHECDEVAFLNEVDGNDVRVSSHRCLTVVHPCLKVIHAVHTQSHFTHRNAV